MKSNLVKAFLLVAVMASGCASTYSSIAKSEDGSYMLTKVTQGFFRVRGTVMRCTPAAQALNCVEIDSP